MSRKRVASVLAAFLTFAAPALGDDAKPAPKSDKTIEDQQTTPRSTAPNLDIESLGDPSKFCPDEKPRDEQPKEKPPIPMC